VLRGIGHMIDGRIKRKDMTVTEILFFVRTGCFDVVEQGVNRKLSSPCPARSLALRLLLRWDILDCIRFAFSLDLSNTGFPCLVHVCLKLTKVCGWRIGAGVGGWVGGRGTRIRADCGSCVISLRGGCWQGPRRARRASPGRTPTRRVRAVPRRPERLPHCDTLYSSAKSI
jgi:hypothetical protein